MQRKLKLNNHQRSRIVYPLLHKSPATMLTAAEMFQKRMADPVMRSWYLSRPLSVQALAQKYPFDFYVVIDAKLPTGLCPCLKPGDHAGTAAYIPF